MLKGRDSRVQRSQGGRRPGFCPAADRPDTFPLAQISTLTLGPTPRVLHVLDAGFFCLCYCIYTRPPPLRCFVVGTVS